MVVVIVKVKVTYALKLFVDKTFADGEFSSFLRFLFSRMLGSNITLHIYA